MPEKTIEIRPAYHEVDQMGYVYHANYINYFHRARTEMMRDLGICDRFVEEQGFMMPVIEVSVKYHNPAGYDNVLRITASLENFSHTRMHFVFRVRDENKLIASGKTTVVMVQKESRKPVRIPEWIILKFTGIQLEQIN